MNKRYIKKLRVSEFSIDFISIEECINQYAEENDLRILQFDIIDDYNAYALFEENFKRGFVREVITYPEGERYGSVTKYECSECGTPTWKTCSICEFCKTRFFDKPSN